MLTLVEQQKNLETQTIEEAKARQQRDNDQAFKRGQWSEAKAGRVYLKFLAKELVGELSSFLVQDKRVGKHHLSAKLLNQTGLEHGTITWLTVKAILNTLAISKKGVKRVTLCRSIADIIHDEWRIRYFAEAPNRKKLLNKLFKDFDRRTYPRHWRKRVIRTYFDAEQVSWEGWSIKQKIHIGYALLYLFQKNTGLLEERDGGTKFVPSDTLIEAINKLMESQTSLFTLYRPMVVKPYPWSSNNLFKGGYISPKIKRYSIIKKSSKKDVERFLTMEWDNILPPINAMQETPWRVNRTMLDALRWSYDVYGGNIGKLPRSDKLDLPAEPHDYRTNEEVKKKHNHLCFLIHDQNRRNKTGQICARMTISIASQFSQYEAIYFPHNLDGRGRAYPLPAFLNPQGPDYSKSLLEFANGLPIETQEQANWIAIVCSNAYGNDKVSLKERIEWVSEQQDMIFSVADNYENDHRWMEASEPFQFLRACIEWKAFNERGFGFVSHMVTTVDATCSGLQHYAAMLRDEVGGKSVNLIPGLPRQDIYGDVATVVIQKLVQDGSPQAKNLLAFGIDRKITKRQVMVVPYAGKFSSCLSYTKEAVNDKLSTGVLPSWNIYDATEDGEHKALLARYIWQAIDEVVVKGKNAMQWLAKTASAYARALNNLDTDDPYSRRMSWKTQDGFEVIHFRTSEIKKLVETNLDGRVQLVVYDKTDNLDPGDMSLAVAPNFVHSLDAAHLRITIIKGLALGITDFGMVHDSFGVHAALMPKFVRDCVKPAFVQMYTDNDVIQEFYDRFKGTCKIDPPPEKGSLSLEGILESEYFFS